MCRKKRINLILILLLPLAMVGVAHADHETVAGVSIPQIDEPDFAALFPDTPIGALGTLLGGGFVSTNPDDTLLQIGTGGTITRLQSAVYEGAVGSAAEGLFAYVYQIECTGGLVAPYEVSIPLAGATLNATAAGLSTTQFGYIATHFDALTPTEPLPTTLFSTPLLNFNLSEFGGTSGLGGNTGGGWTHVALGSDEVLAGSTIENFWSGTLLVFVTDSPPVISHVTVLNATIDGQPNTVAAVVPHPGVGPTPDLPPDEIIVEPPEVIELIEVVVDVKPGSDPNAVNTKSHGVLPIGIYGSDTFDVQDIDISTIHVECMGNTTEDITASFEDLIVADGIEDLVLHVPMQNFPWGAPRGTLVPITVTGLLLDGTAFFGIDEVWIVK